jgi:hypothetical protein
MQQAISIRGCTKGFFVVSLYVAGFSPRHDMKVWRKVTDYFMNKGLTEEFQGKARAFAEGIDVPYQPGIRHNMPVKE